MAGPTTTRHPKRTGVRGNHTTGRTSWTLRTSARKTATPGPPFARVTSIPTNCAGGPRLVTDVATDRRDLLVVDQAGPAQDQADDREGAAFLATMASDGF